ncbi:MAG TPA: hypothetical protein VHB21_26415 [Minicystis sp.]|nr:hypothetical protein [Minicystis sp.]
MHPNATLSRRDLIRALGGLAAAAALPACNGGEIVDPTKAPFLTPEERAAIDALADYVLPADDLPGGGGLGASTYIENMLTALDGGPGWFAGGPFSGRQPFGDGEGGASSEYPPDAFASFLPLDRVSLAAVRLFLYGSDGVPGGGPNDHVLGKVVGLRDQVKQAIGGAVQSSAVPFDQLDAQGVKDAFVGLDRDVQALFIELVCQAAFSAPEYGGNANGDGWKLAHFAGDSQPLGYSLFDEKANDYRERADAPVTTADPGADPEPMDAETKGLVEFIAMAQGGTVFK